MISGAISDWFFFSGLARSGVVRTGGILVFRVFKITQLEIDNKFSLFFFGVVLCVLRKKKRTSNVQRMYNYLLRFVVVRGRRLCD